MGAPAISESRTDRGSDAAELRRAEQVSELGLEFHRVFRVLLRLRGRDTHLPGSELSYAQFQLLSQLSEHGELPLGELAAAAELAPGTVTQMLDGLADSGRVQRVRSASDRRVVVTRLTDLGRREIDAKRTASKERWEVALTGLGERELRAATKVLTRLASMFEQLPEAACADDSKQGATGAPKGRKAL